MKNVDFEKADSTLYYSSEQIELHCGDCREVLPTLPVANLILADPYYDDFNEDFLREMNLLFRSKLYENGIVVWFTKMPYTGLVQVITTEYFKFINEYIWHFRDATGYRAKYMPLIRHQNILVFSNGGTSNIDMDAIRMPVIFEDRKPVSKGRSCRRKTSKEVRMWKPNPKGDWRSSVLEIGKAQSGLVLRSETPIGVKPVELIDVFIKGYSKKGDIIIDPFVGSGSALVSARALERVAYGIDIEEKFCFQAQCRLEAEAQEIFGLEEK